MHEVTLGSTGITVKQNAFGALPIQRISTSEAVALVQAACAGGMRYFDTARSYSDSEEKLGLAFAGMRDQVFIATKTQATTPNQFWKDLDCSLEKLQTDHIDVYQFHDAKNCYAPDDGSGMYECMLEAKRQDKIGHIGLTAHRIGIARACVASGLYETLQFPFSYLSGSQELELVESCTHANMGFICMKGLAGGLITRSDVAMAFIAEHPGVLPIWGIQKQSELDEWLSYMDATPEMTAERRACIEHDRTELSGQFCRGCGYCLPCPAGIIINQCARMSLMLRRAPSKSWLTSYWQTEMAKIDDCQQCRQCAERCPYGLDTPELLKRNRADYLRVLAGEVKVC